MALSYTSTQWGIAIIRRVAGSGTSGWEHVAWVNPNDIVIDSPTTGQTYDYQVLIVHGSNAATPDTISVTGRQVLVAANIKR